MGSRLAGIGVVAAVLAFGILSVAASGDRRRATYSFQPIVSGLTSPTYVTSAPGTPGGSTPWTKSRRFARSGVSAETMEMRPATVANHASRMGGAGRRTPER